MNKNNKFEANKVYFTISIYALAVVLASVIMVRLIPEWKEVKAIIGGFVSAVSPFIIGFFIAYLVNPLNQGIQKNLLDRTKWFQKNPKSKGFTSILLSYILVIGAVVLFIFFVVPQVVESILELLDNLTPFYKEINSKVNHFLTKSSLMQENPEISQHIRKYIPTLFEEVTTWLSGIVPKLYELSVSIVQWTINFIIAIVISIYMMVDKKRMKNSARRMIKAFLPEKKGRALITDVEECNRILSGFLIGKAIDSLIIGLLCFILMVILRLPYAALVSVIVGITNMIPYFGPFIGAVPGTLFVLVAAPYKAIVFVVMIFILQQIDGVIIGPKILGDSIGMRPIGILFAITIGGAYAGVIGMFLGVPVLAIIMYLFDKVVERKLEEKRKAEQKAAVKKAKSSK